MKVFKYPFDVAGVVDILLPRYSQIVHYGCDPEGRTCVWASVFEDENIRETQSFHVVGTGQPVPVGTVYRTTFLQGPCVWHIFI